MPIYSLNKDTSCRIVSIPNVSLLESLGIRKGIKVKLKNKQPLGGPVVVQMGTRNIAIGRDIANQIMVEVI
ncbi:MAG: ferrous iron transport protein A [Tissierellia bacterium]|nr:ferrous iron transport protein A [Tissierellia bacterium]